MSTIRVRGTGGAEFDIDDPFEEPDTRSKEIHREQLAKREIAPVVDVHEDPDDKDPEDPEDQDDDSNEDEDEALEAPARNASAAAWREYAEALGADPAEVADLGRDELVARFAPQA
jgi:hypothetical protein